MAYFVIKLTYSYMINGDLTDLRRNALNRTCAMMPVNNETTNNELFCIDE